MRQRNKHRTVVRAILRWYAMRGRTLPWRGISNPYRILISEIMLQQTQVSRVLEKYPQFLRRFPTLRSLARAQQRDVVLAWRGMGYNNRAVRLHQLALAVVHHHRGKIPQDFDSLIALPGIGRYTANALLSSAFRNQVPVVDVNIQRLLSRIFWRMKTTGAMRRTHELWDLAEAILPKGRAYDWNQALMDVGALVCTARNPKCASCPVGSLCSSRTTMTRTPAPRSQREPALNGIPHRIYRGRIVEALRGLNGTQSIRADVLARAIHPNFGRRNVTWFRTLLSRLERDGLIHVRGNRLLHSTRVSLA
jgi:A/G-specific adenine glycosylase